MNALTVSWLPCLNACKFFSSLKKKKKDLIFFLNYILELCHLSLPGWTNSQFSRSVLALGCYYKLPLSLIVKYVVFMKVSHFQFALAGSSFFWCLSHLLRFYVLLFIRYLILSCDILLSLHLYIQATRNILLFSFYLDD